MFALRNPSLLPYDYHITYINYNTTCYTDIINHTSLQLDELPHHLDCQEEQGGEGPIFRPGHRFLHRLWRLRRGHHQRWRLQPGGGGGTGPDQRLGGLGAGFSVGAMVVLKVIYPLVN